MSSPQRRQKNPIEEHACINEAIKKELKHTRIHETFNLNPRSLVIISDKPTRSTLINVREETKDYSEGLSQEIKDKLLNSTAPPKTKSFYPQTSNQEFGWDSDMVGHT
mmetsp:Transcript_3299/g.6835  ORF Transcript_3299/g.6835 Transcript_3299/m.6835 type:complete len:108 (-) Transcript_3299:138-461(-)